MLFRSHERTIFPLLRRRPLFSGADAFYLYDFLCHGAVNDNVFVYSNRKGGERALVVVHNAHGEVAGVIGTSTGKRIKEGEGEGLISPQLYDGLGLGEQDAHFWRFRDATSDLEYLRRRDDLLGSAFFLALGSYGVHVFIDWQPLAWDEHLDALCTRLGGQPVAQFDHELIALRFAPEQAALRRLLSEEGRHVITACSGKKPTKADRAVESALADFLLLFGQKPLPLSTAQCQLVEGAESSLSLLVWALLRQGDAGEDLPAVFAAQGLDRVLGEILGDTTTLPLYRALWRHRAALADLSLAELLPHLCAESELRATLNWHEWEGKSYVDQGALTTLLQRLEEILVFELTGGEVSEERRKTRVAALSSEITALAKKAELNAYQLEKFCDFE